MKWCEWVSETNWSDGISHSVWRCLVLVLCRALCLSVCRSVWWGIYALYNVAQWALCWTAAAPDLAATVAAFSISARCTESGWGRERERERASKVAYCVYITSGQLIVLAWSWESVSPLLVKATAASAGFRKVANVYFVCFHTFADHSLTEIFHCI